MLLKYSLLTVCKQCLIQENLQANFNEVSYGWRKKIIITFAVMMFSLIFVECSKSAAKQAESDECGLSRAAVIQYRGLIFMPTRELYIIHFMKAPSATPNASIRD